MYILFPTSFSLRDQSVEVSILPVASDVVQLYFQPNAKKGTYFREFPLYSSLDKRLLQLRDLITPYTAGAQTYPLPKGSDVVSEANMESVFTEDVSFGLFVIVKIYMVILRTYIFLQREVTRKTAVCTCARRESDFLAAISSAVTCLAV